MTFKFFLRIAALVLFILAVLVLFVGSIDREVYEGLLAGGLASWVASTL
jgi:hypothetical protein